GREQVTCAGSLGPNERARRSAWADALGSRATAFRARHRSSTRADSGSQIAVSSGCRLSAPGTSAQIRGADFCRTLPNWYSIADQPWQHRERWFPQGIKRERGACVNTLCRGCPRNCKRRVFGQTCHWEFVCSWEGGRKTAIRKPGHLPPTTVTRERGGRGVPAGTSS